MRSHHQGRPERALELNEEERLLTVATDMGGGVLEKPEVLAGIRELRRMGETCPKPGPRDLRIGLIFDVPGSVWQPSYEGSRAGRFSMVERMLHVEVAVPDSLTGKDVGVYLSNVLRDMIILAKGYLKRRRLSLSTEKIEQAANELAARASELTDSTLSRLGQEYADRILADTEKMLRGDR